MLHFDPSDKRSVMCLSITAVQLDHMDGDFSSMEMEGFTDRM